MVVWDLFHQQYVINKHFNDFSSSLWGNCAKDVPTSRVFCDVHATGEIWPCSLLQGLMRSWGWCWKPSCLICPHMGVSENRVTPKSSILVRFSIINHPFWGTLFSETSTQIHSHNDISWPWVYIHYLSRPTTFQTRNREWKNLGKSSNIPYIYPPTQDF